MAQIAIDVEDCPKCGSEDIHSYFWQRGQAWIIICEGCKHEDGRENTEREAVAVWNEAAHAAHLLAQEKQP